MKTITSIIMIFLIGLLCASCVTLPGWGESSDPVKDLRSNLTTAQERVTTSRDDLERSTRTIRESSQEIEENTGEIEDRIPPDTDNEVRERLDSIGDEAAVIRSETDTLEDITRRLTDARDNLEEVEDNTDQAVADTETLRERIRELEDEKQAALRKALNYLIVIAILLIAISAVGVFQGNYKAIGGIIGGVIIIVASLAVSVLYAKLAWIGLVGIVGVVLIVAFGIYQGISNKKEKKKDEKALEETVLTVEALKDKLPEDAKKDFFGDKAYPGRTKTIQSKETEEKVLNIRRKLKDIIDPVIPGK